MKIWKTILIEDELLARQRLKRLLGSFEQIEIIAEADNGETGLALITELSPDLIFLDIEMPVLNGFDMLAKLQSQPRIIFTTAYDQFAIRAFEQNSVDYLLKPIEKERLEQSLKKLSSLTPAPEAVELKNIIRQVQQSVIKTLTVKTGDRIILVRLSEISYIQADQKYVYLFTQDGKKYLTDHTLSKLEERLPEHFVRVHRAVIINADQIREIRKGFNGVFNFILNNHEKTPISSSRSNSDELRNRFDI